MFKAILIALRATLKFLAGSVLVLTLAACSPGIPPADVTIINGQDPETLDPALATGLEDLRAITALFEGLTRNDPVTSRAVPGLAESWTVSDDGRVYTFTLRAGLKWSTGDLITAADVVYSWRRVLSPATAADYAGQLFYLKNAEAFFNGQISDVEQIGVEAVDDQTLRVELENPTPFFLELCAFQTLAVVPRQAIEQHGDQWLRAKPLPTSGAYQLDFWRLNDRIRLRKNPNYWDAANTQTEVVDLLPISAPSTAFNLYEAGHADVIWDKDVVPSDLLDLLQTRPDYHTFNYLGAYFIRFNTTKPPLDDPRVRRALALSIDKKRITEKIIKGGAQPATHLVPPGVANYEPPPGPEHNPDEARRLLAEAGFPGGEGFPQLSYLFDAAAGGGAKVHAKIAIELQQMWKQELGITIQSRQMEKKVYLNAQTALDYDISRSSWVGDYNDPATFLDLFLSNNGNNRTGWKNERYDALVHEANLKTDLAERAKLLREAETLLISEGAPLAPIYFYVGFTYYDPEKISGIHANILDVHPIRAIAKQKK